MQTLILNHDFQPLHTVPWQRAMCLVFKEKVEVLKYSTKTIKTPNTEYNVPIIIRLIKAIRRIYKNSVPVTRKNILTRDNHTCQYCGHKISGDLVTIDHVIPKSKGGKNIWDNLVTCCISCNTKKDNKLPSEAKMVLIKQPKKPTISEFLKLKLKNDGLYQVFNEFLGEY